MKARNKIIRLLTGDIILIFLSYCIAILWKSGSFNTYLIDIRYFDAFLSYTAIAIITSALFGKYSILGKTGIKNIVLPVIKSNLMIIGIVSILIYVFQLFYYSRTIVFVTIIFLTLFELLGALFYYYIQKTLRGNVFDIEGKIVKAFVKQPDSDIDYDGRDEAHTTIYSAKELNDLEVSLSLLNHQNKEIIIEESGEKVYAYLTRFIDISNPRNAILSTTTRFNIEKQPANFLKAIVNLHRINDIRRINKFFESVNRRLPEHGIFISCVETKNIRKKRIFNKFPWGFSHIYYLIDFLYKRVWPKLPGLNRAYFFLNQGHNRVLSKQEVMGRLYSCGFRIISEVVIDQLQYFVSEKIKKPVYDQQPSYGPIFRMRRLGKEGNIIYVYKFRTMYPYSEYLQEYIYEKHKLEAGGKLYRDIRVTTIGRIFRRFWLDELPMLVNWFRGELKLVGVRPLSEHYMTLYPEELRRYRMKFKPGLLPPFYADLPEQIEGIVASEMKYLQLYSRSPFLTDFRYFFKIWFNIIFKKARSK